MKYIQIKPSDGLTEELHKEIKSKAAKSGMSIPKYLLKCAEHPVAYWCRICEKFQVGTELCGCNSKQEPCKHEWGTITSFKGKEKIHCSKCEGKKKPKKSDKISKKIKRNFGDVLEALSENADDIAEAIAKDTEKENCQKCLYPLKAVEHTCGKK